MRKCLKVILGGLYGIIGYIGDNGKENGNNHLGLRVYALHTNPDWFRVWFYIVFSLLAES